MADIFLSYADAGLDAASYLKESLEAEGLVVFLAAEDIAPFTEWEEEIEKNLKAMRCFVPVWTDDFGASKWAIMESTFAWFNRDAVAIAPVLLSGDPPDHPTNRIQACTAQHAPELPPMPSPDEYDEVRRTDRRWRSWAREVAKLVAERIANRE